MAWSAKSRRAPPNSFRGSVTNLARTIDLLKERGIWVVGTDGEAPQTLYAADLKRPLALVLGAEGTGMRRLTRERCDFVVRIPMAGQVRVAQCVGGRGGRPVRGAPAADRVDLRKGAAKRVSFALFFAG